MSQTDSPTTSFTLAIANIAVTVSCNTPVLTAALWQRYRAFATRESAQFTVRIDLEGTQRASALLDTGIRFHDGVLRFTAPGYEGFINEEAGGGELRLSSAQPVEEVDYFLRVVYALLALHAGGLLLHAAGIVRGGRAYLFFGPSGCGKTTVARLSRSGRVLNDDLVLLLPAAKGWQAYATPFWSPSQVRPTGPAAAPIAEMFRLVQDIEVYREEISQAEALAALMASVPVVTSDPQRVYRVLDVCRHLLQTVPVARLHFRRDASFWRLVNLTGG